MKNKIIQNNLISCVMAVILTAIICVMTYGHLMSDALILQAENQAYLLKEICESEADDIAALAAMEDSFNARITLISKDGTVLFDSAYDETALENHLEREEIIQAMHHTKGSSQRYSYTDLSTNYYYALKLSDNSVIRVGVRSNQAFSVAILPNLPVIVMALIAIIAMIFFVSESTTKRIVNTIEHFNFDVEDSTSYEELSPFIDKIKSQNETIKKQIGKTAAEKDKLASIFANMEESLIVCDRKKMVVQHNRQAQKIFGVKENDRLFEIIDDAQLNDNIDMAVQGQKVHGLLKHNKLSYQYTISPNIQNGENKGVIIIFLDITQQVESQRMRREFTANVTHELKTPLTSILGYSQLISSGIAKPEDVADFASVIEKNAQQLLTLIEDIMQLSALDEGGEQETAAINIKSVINEILQDLQPVTDEKQISVTAQLEDITIQANYKNIGDLCRNLISNAIKYNKPNGSIDITLEQKDSNVVFKVRDTGIGIAENNIHKVFQRFYVVDKSRNKNISSTGLGLSIVKHIVTQMKGDISLESKQGEGSTFTVTLPLNTK